MKRVYSGWNRSWCGTGRHNSGWSRRSRGCSVYVALQKKILTMPKGHEQLRTVATMTVAAEGDMSYDHRGSSFGHVGRTEDKSAWPTCNLWNLVFPKMSSFS
ncbi:hypothetical protein BHE74_00053436 [Ensete ventricosum]|nr:hypothetical protein BHE74_00053436 [Ensete ventricosum]